MSLGLIIIATKPKYVEYAHNLIGSMAEYFQQATPIVFTDQPQSLGAVANVYFTPALGFPKQTLYRYHIILEKEHILCKFDHLFYADADMLFVDYVKPEDIISTGITATLHPGYAHERTHGDGKKVLTTGSPERGNPDSKAYIPFKTPPDKVPNKYFCGGFNGGAAHAYLRMARALRDNIDCDQRMWGLDYSAIWHDESYMNRYLYDNPPTRILTPSFCYPENYDGLYGWPIDLYEPKLLALDKASRGGR